MGASIAPTIETSVTSNVAASATVTISGHTGNAANTAMNQIFVVKTVTSPTVAVLTGTGMTAATYNTGTIKATFSMAAKGNLCHVECSNRGLCDYGKGECKCFDGWKGAACTSQITNPTREME